MINHRFGVLERVSVRIGGNARVRPLSKIGETAKPRCHRPDPAPGATALKGRPSSVRAAKGLARSTRPDQDVSGRIAQPVIAPGADLEPDGPQPFMAGPQLTPASADTGPI